MAIPSSVWLDVIAREYLNDFIPRGGAAVRFAVADGGVLDHVAGRLREHAGTAGLEFIRLDLATTRLHMLHNVVFALTQALPWKRLLRNRLRSLVAAAGYHWPETAPDIDLGIDLGADPLLPILAEINGVAAHLLRRDLTQALSREIWQDSQLTLDFRSAMIALLDARLTGDEATVAAVMGWLHGTLRSIGQVKSAQIGRRIGRQNARGVLMSLCHWLRQCGGAGIVLALDIRQLHRERRVITEGLVYSPAAVMDCYEVLRQMIDDAQHFPGLFLVALADDAFLNDDPRRSLGQYTALQMRVWDDVRPQDGDNPLAPLVRFEAPAP